ncbi:aspartyl protease family protein [Hyphomonas sp.]|uniref:aspartyl protease family protein n=1 Tax=Hyphomonas sp. TaxID=87 RepID=UPI003527D295
MTRESKRRPTKMADGWHTKGALFSLLALMGSFPAVASERQVIPFEVNEYDHIVVRMEVNGNDRATAVIDTAATFPMINRRTARLAEIPELGENPPLISVLGLAGEDIFPVVSLDSMVVGNVSKTDMPVALNEDFDVIGTQNVLPANAFEGDVLDFDFENQRVMVYDGRPDRSVRLIPSSIRYEDRDGLIFIQVEINGRKGKALVDTGSNVTFINSSFAEYSGTRTNEEKTKLLQGATNGDLSLRIATARSMDIGDYGIARADILVSDPPLFEYMGLDQEPAMVLGIDILSAFRVQIDRRRNRLILSVPGARQRPKALGYSPTDAYIREP